MLIQKKGLVVHPNPENLRLVIWKTSRIKKQKNEILQQLRDTWKGAEYHKPKEFTMQYCASSKAG